MSIPFDDEPAPPLCRQAVLLLAHGSRDAKVAWDLETLRRAVARKLAPRLVTVGHFELAAPSLEQAVLELVTTGVGSITIVPYFLHLGRHVRLDVPTRVAELASQHHNVCFRLAAHIGFDTRLVSILVDRVHAAGGAA